MKFIISSGELQKALQTVSGVISSSQSRPILENYLFELDGNNVTITASDGETTLVTSLEVKSDDSGKFAVPAKIFQDFIKTYGEQPLTFVVKDNAEGTGSQLEILDEKDNFAVALDNADDYPELPEFDASQSVVMPAGVLSEALTNTLFATSNDSLRPVMTGVLFQFGENETNFVSTDSHRLVVYKRADLMNAEPMEFIMPKKPLNIFKNILASSNEEVKIDFNENMAKFTFDKHIWICRLIDGKYPNYTAVIPKENPNVLTINRNLLLGAIKRASIMSNKSTNQVRFKLSGNILHLHAEDTEYANKADMQIPCDYNGEDINIGFSSKFLTEMLTILGSDDITMKMSQPNRPGIIEPLDGLEENENILMLSMPVIGL
ncbi:DNA polymerase III subunit beta [Chryseobacterium indologenes]|uniref:Beta sliding clamp n=1 Tax=Chryseobacterium indologenes TaxID=253 RepID=A0A1Z3W2L5_CHRID|nr:MULTISPECIES: DNA polymerase III subunit beta [Chryseobacterium]ASE61777.1 DNA polymerase III subunit beta [Chryseobacterium indologenes]ATN05735.1 DNA polymerase III subunit beta [Chryseobacterium indologenes]AYY85507.1 DNA polymerase III subunit beta [Chryseobacterium indologenes]AYZ35276.1 DNA polymerase III subunit beta [Chryseobacterium indologenes]AZB17385.1 DNA polymerase III subunit beta [Chryseobacterium indologenes]